MSKITGHVDDETYFYRIEYNTRSTWDMREMASLIEGGEASVEDYDDERVVVKVRAPL